LGFAINWDRPTDTALHIVNDTMITGHRFSTGWAKDEKVFFVARFSRPITAHQIVDPADTAGAHTRAWLQFASGRAPLVVRVGISYVDEDGALRNLEAEAADASFDQLRGAARDAWRQALGGVQVKGGDDVALRTFYTALYHTKLAPVVFQDVDGRYRGADGEIQTASGFTNYSIFSLWDTFRAEHPLLTILEPDRVGDMIQSMLAFRDQSGWLPVWSLVGNETNTMTGYHAAPVIADAILKGIGGFDADRALAAMLDFSGRDWRGLDLYRKYGYVPSELEDQSVTKTLEYAYDDWAVAQAARRLGHQDAYVVHMQRSTDWMNVFDASTRFARGRMADGKWVEPFDPLRSEHQGHSDYTEGNAWQHTWFVPQDPRGLIDEMGGDAAFIARLDTLFTQDTTLTGTHVAPDISGLIGQYAHGNEPSHHIAYLYDYAGAPWKTQAAVRRIMDTLYSDKPAGLPGNEDCGQISAWYVFSAMGFYPVNPVGGVYALGTPRFDALSVDVGGGRTFRVVANGAAEGKPYIQSATLNGEPLDQSWITHGDILAGGTLELVMGAAPNPAWASARTSRPPSLAGPASMSVPGRHAMADVVRTEFRHAWDGYRQYAWGHDALRPLSRTGSDWYDHSLLMTPVDGFDTMLLMGMRDRATAAKRLVLDSLSFDRDMDVQVFEVTIRLLGGLLSAHQLDGDGRFLDLAKDLADRLMPAFDTPTGMPCRFVNLRSGDVRDCVSNPAEIGTLLLEFGTLSRLTGDTTYMHAARRAIDGVYQRRSKLG
ncbi:MAG TPA: GH92 family glycosyl hydrolase, partial [Longimicrobiales bacterium]|nr:GH92 family glycosyl hydrolase [Longimicrobiales bacterium]